MGQLSSQLVVGVVVGGVVVPEKVHNNSINCTGCLSTQLLTTQSYNKVIRVGTSAQKPSKYVCKTMFEHY